MSRLTTRALALLILIGLPLAALAHKPSDSYLTLNGDGAAWSGRWDIALRDLEYAVGLDANGDGAITWGELRTRQTVIAAYALSRLAITANDTACPLSMRRLLVDRHSDGAYSVLEFDIGCAPAAPLTIAYHLFFDLDPTHHGLLRADWQGRSQTAILTPERPRLRIAPQGRSGWSQFREYLGEGVWHIWIGLDHVLFLLTLLLPAVVRLHADRWQPVGNFGSALRDVAKVVTAFTVAHSITLSLAALGVVTLPSRFVESAIAVSVLAVAINNVWPVFTDRRWLVAFAFGLVHGFGFASVLHDLGLPGASLALALFAFNAGVELGQLAIVALFLPLVFYAGRLRLYPRLALQLGSLMIAVVAFGWFIERAFNLRAAVF